MSWAIARCAANRQRPTTSPRCAGLPSRRCNAARSASPPHPPTRTRLRMANWCRRDADADELVGIGSALGTLGMGAFGMNSDFDDEDYELAWMTKLARQTGRPVWFLLTDRWRR